MACSLISFIGVLNIFLANGEELFQGRVIRSHAATPKALRYVVSLQTSQTQHFCGGSLVHKYWVLTAARCNIGVDHMMIVAGDYTLGVFEGTEQYSKPYSLIPHPLYNRNTSNADIMLIKNTGVLPGKVCGLSGWGSTDKGGLEVPRALHTVNVPIISTAECNGSRSFDGNISSNMICGADATGGRDACQGDSGAPLVCEGRVYGLVSRGNGCGDSRFLGVYTAVSRFRRWIDQTIYRSIRRCRKS